MIKPFSNGSINLMMMAIGKHKKFTSNHLIMKKVTLEMKVIMKVPYSKKKKFKEVMKHWQSSHLRVKLTKVFHLNGEILLKVLLICLMEI